MTDSSTTAGAPQEARLPVRAELAAAWTGFVLLYLYVDYLALYKPGFIDEIRGGVVHGFDTGPTFVALALALVAVPILMVVLSAALPARVGRVTNLVVAALYVPVTVYNADGEPWSYAWFYGLSIGLELLILAFVLRTAWTWPGTSPRTARSTAGRDRTPARA